METKAQNYWIKIFHTLNESQKRWCAAQKATEIGYGGITKVKALTSMSRTTITNGIRELRDQEQLEKKIRKEGAGRKKITNINENIVRELELIMNENTAGDPMSALKWTCKSTRNISDELYCSTAEIALFLNRL